MDLDSLMNLVSFLWSVFQIIERLTKKKRSPKKRQKRKRKKRK